MKSRNYTNLLAAIVVAVLTMAATCKKAGTTSACKNTPAFTTQIKPIIDANCGGCHSTQYKAGGIELTSYALISAESKKSKFMGAVRHLAGFDPMPKKAPKLSDSVLQVLQCWVDGGSPE